MKKTKLTRSLLAACSIVALSVVVYGCDSGPSQTEFDEQKSAAEAAAAEAAAAAAARAEADAAAAAARAAQAEAEAEAAAAAEAQAAAEQMAAEAAAGQAEAEAAAAAAAARQAEAEAAAAAAAQAQAEAEARATAAEAAQAEAEAERTLALALQAAAEDDAEAARMAEAAAEAARAEAAAAKATADAAAAAALAAQAEAEARATAAEAARATAEGDAEAARMAQAAAEMAKMQAEEAAEAAEMAKMQAEEAAEAAKMAQMEAERERDAAIAAREGLEEEDTRTEAQKASDAAKALLAVLADATANVGTDGSTPVHTAPSPTVSVSTDGMLMAEATDYDMSDMAPDMIDDGSVWRGATLMNSEGDTATVYTDIGNDGTQTLLDRYVSNLPTPTAARSWSIGGTDQVPWSAVMRPDEMTTVGGTSANPITVFEGTVHGISGTFACDGADNALCTAPTTFSDGQVDPTGATDGTWMFTPDEGVATYTDDPTYLTFGWWLSKGANGEPDDLTLIVSAMGMGDAARTTAAGSIRGSATYEGGAAGKYAFASTSDDTYEGGHFTASATLEVDFDADLDGTNAVDDNAGVTLSGTIDNFMTGDMARPSWSVALMVDGDGATSDSTTIPMTDLAGDTDATMSTEWSTGGALKGTGIWDADWWGGEDTEHPMAVTGTFNAHIGTADADSAVGRLQGAFAANKQ